MVHSRIQSGNLQNKPEVLVEEKCKEVLKERKIPQHSGYVKGTQEPNEELQWPELEQSEQQDKMALDYD